MAGPKAKTNKNKKSKKVAKRRKTGIFVGLFVLVSAAFVVAAAALDAPAIIAEMLNPPQIEETPSVVETVDTYTIADGVFIDGINVSGLTKDEALQRLAVEVRDIELDRQINISHSDLVFAYTLSDFNVRHDFQAVVDFAYSIGRDREVTTAVVQLASDISFDSGSVSNVISEIVNSVNRESKNASMTRVNGQFVITPEVVGYEVNQQRLVEELVNAINRREAADITLELNTSIPEFTEAIFARSTDRLGSFYTIISGNDPGRNQNLINASYKIDNYMVFPGEIFSTNRAFGPMTYENGYRMAPIIVNGQLVPGMGGGVCQVSTNLYIALVFAEVRIVERLNHSMRVMYVDYAWDATLAGDIIDLRFENDTGYPLTIVAYIVGNRSYVHIYGHERRAPGRRLELFSIVTERIPAPEETIIEVATLAPGVREVIAPARGGVVAELHKIVFDGDRELYRERVNISRYRARGAIVHVGIGEPPQYGEAPGPVEGYPEPPYTGTPEPPPYQPPYAGAPEPSPYVYHPVIHHDDPEPDDDEEPPVIVD